MKARGFTLIEVMLAVVIVAIMSALVWASFGRLLSVTSEIEKQDAFWHGVRIGLSRVAREMSMAFVSDNYDRERYRADDPENRPTFFTIEDSGERDRVSFTAFVGRRLYQDEKASDQAVVEYFLDDEDGRTHLYRRYKGIIDEDWDRGGETAILMENVEGFDVQWWNPDEETWERQWSTRRREEHNRLPSRLRITIRALDPDGEAHTFTTQTRILMEAPLSW